MSRFPALRYGTAAVCVAATLAVATLPALAADLATTREAWMRNREQADQTTVGLEHLGAEVVQAGAEYDAVVARLRAERDELRRLRSDLAAAVDRLHEAEAANDVTIRRLGQATMVMATMQEGLAAHVADLDIEVAAAYKYAGSSARFHGVIDALLESESLGEFTIAYEQLRSSTVDQHGLVQTVTVLAEDLRQQRLMVDALQRRAQKAELKARTERNEVARLTRRQETLVAQIAVDRARNKKLLRQLEEQRLAAEERLGRLDSQSEALTAELRAFGQVAGVPGTGDLLWPTDGASTSGYGLRVHPILNTSRLHAGIDIPAPTGQAVYSAGDGVVVSAGARGGYGNAVVIDHGDGVSTVYAHLHTIAVTSGQQVRAATAIGQVGSTGLSTGPHLHFEIRFNGSPRDPLDWF